MTHKSSPHPARLDKRRWEIVEVPPPDGEDVPKELRGFNTGSMKEKPDLSKRRSVYDRISKEAREKREPRDGGKKKVRFATKPQINNADEDTDEVQPASTEIAGGNEYAGKTATAPVDDQDVPREYQHYLFLADDLMALLIEAHDIINQVPTDSRKLFEVPENAFTELERTYMPVLEWLYGPGRSARILERLYSQPFQMLPALLRHVIKALLAWTEGVTEADTWHSQSVGGDGVAEKSEDEIMEGELDGLASLQDTVTRYIYAQKLGAHFGNDMEAATRFTTVIDDFRSGATDPADSIEAAVLLLAPDLELIAGINLFLPEDWEIVFPLYDGGDVKRVIEGGLTTDIDLSEYRRAA